MENCTGRKSIYLGLQNVSNLKLEPSFCFSSLRESEQFYASILMWFFITAAQFVPFRGEYKVIYIPVVVAVSCSVY